MPIYVSFIYIRGIKFEGPRIAAISWQDAAYQAQQQGIELGGKLVMEVTCDENFTPDWENAIDYELEENN